MGRRAVVAAAAVALMLAASAGAAERGDFDDDGRVDLAVGVPGDDVLFINNQENAGSVNVLPGAKGGIDPSGGDTYLTQATANNIPGPFESFGDELAAGDFDGDGHSDLAVGVPFDAPGGVSNAGSVNVFYGTDSGLTGTDAQLFSQDSTGVPEDAESADWFGTELASGDFDDDGRDDLAVCAVQDDVATNLTDGTVIVLYGGASGLSGTGSQLWTQDTSGLEGEVQGGERFGESLAAGDFDGDDHDDLALGSPTEDAKAGTVSNAGAVNVVYGSDTGLTVDGNEFIQQGIGKIDGQPAIEEAFGEFGGGLAAGDANHDGRDDLAVGISNENGGSFDGRGAVQFFRASVHGLIPAHDRIVTQATKRVPGKPRPGDGFGTAVAFGEFNHDKRADLAIGVPGERRPHAKSAGAVNVIAGSKQGLSTKGAQLWSQATKGVLGKPGKFDFFGGSLASGDFDGRAGADLAIGARGDRTFGAVNVLYSSRRGLSSKGDDLFNQNSQGVSDFAEEADRFGQRLAPP